MKNKQTSQQTAHFPTFSKLTSGFTCHASVFGAFHRTKSRQQSQAYNSLHSRQTRPFQRRPQTSMVFGLDFLSSYACITHSSDSPFPPCCRCFSGCPCTSIPSRGQRERRLEWCYPLFRTRPRRPNHQLPQISQSTQLHTRVSVLTLRLHSLQTARFTEQRVDSSLRPNGLHSRQSLPSCGTTRHLCSQGRAFTAFRHVRAPLLGQILPRQVVNIVQECPCTATLSRR